MLGGSLSPQQGASPGWEWKDGLQLWRVLENRMLRRIFGPKRDEVTGEWRVLHNEEIRDLYSSPSIIRIIKSRRMRWGRGRRIGYW
jgi:hypothetical protein